MDPVAIAVALVALLVSVGAAVYARRQANAVRDQVVVMREANDFAKETSQKQDEQGRELSELQKQVRDELALSRRAQEKLASEQQAHTLYVQKTYEDNKARELAEELKRRAARLEVSGPWYFTDTMNMLNLKNVGQARAEEIGLEVISTADGTLANQILFSGDTVELVRKIEPGAEHSISVRSELKEAFPINVRLIWRDQAGSHTEDRQVIYG